MSARLHENTAVPYYVQHTGDLKCAQHTTHKRGEPFPELTLARNFKQNQTNAFCPAIVRLVHNTVRRLDSTTTTSDGTSPLWLLQQHRKTTPQYNKPVTSKLEHTIIPKTADPLYYISCYAYTRACVCPIPINLFPLTFPFPLSTWLAMFA